MAEGQTAKRVATLLGTHGAWVDYSASVEIRRYLKCEGGVPAVINFAKTPNGAPKVETWFWDATGVPMASRAMVRFDGGKTVACRVDVDATTTVVHAYWDGSGYRGDRGAGGLARVTSGIRLKDHLNTAAKAGAISKTITMNLSLTGYVYFMSGNSISAENQRIRPVATVPPC